MNLRSVQLLDLREPEIDRTRFTTDGINLKLQYAHFGGDGREVIGAIRFFAVLAYRFERFRNITSYRTEPWVADIINAIAEVRDSSWVEQIERVEGGPWPFAKRHYLVCLAWKIHEE
jgi:hypothetical protein